MLINHELLQFLSERLLSMNLKKKPKEILNSYKTIHLNELHWYFAFILKCIREIDLTWNALFDALPTQNELTTYF